jgi:hypothetical protein
LLVEVSLQLAMRGLSSLAWSVWCQWTVSQGLPALSTLLVWPVWPARRAW